MPLQIRRGTNAEREDMTVPLAPGEPLYTTDQGFLYIGDGTTLGGIVVSGYQDENAVDAVGAALVAGQNQNINFIYGPTQDVANRIDAVIDLSVYSGEISADGFRGSLFANNSSLLVDADNGSIILDGTVKGNIIPDQNEVYDIGSLTNRFRDLYLSGSSLWLGNAQLTATGSAINLPAGTTIGGLAVGIPGGDLNINIIGDDSSVMVNTSTQQIIAAGGFVGNVTGNIAGNVTGNLTGNVTGNLTGNLTGNVTGNLVGTTEGLHIGEVKGSVFGDDSTLLVDGIDRIFNGTLNTGNYTISNIGITSSGTPLRIGNPSSIIDVQLFLGDNLQIRTIDPNGRGFITSTMSRGTLDSPLPVQAGDEIGGLLFNAYTDSSTSAIAGLIGFAIDPTAVIAGGTFVKSQIILSCATDTTQDANDAFLLDSAGVATSNVFAAEKFFQLPVYADDTARTTAIPTPTAGMMIFMASGTTPAATNKMQLFDGSNWVNLN
jgi:hypothetical protein